jgi:DNA-binding GntR family transcriptional regulator
MSLRDRVVGAIRDAIIQGKFRPGEKIPELELAGQLGVSRTPIREAIQVLEQQGLLEIRPKNGTYIRAVNWDDARDGLTVRISLEELAVRQALERLDPDEWGRLCDQVEALIGKMRDAIGAENPSAATECDVELHALLIEAASNPYLSRAWQNTGLAVLVWSPERELYPLAPGESRVAFVARHEELLSALRGRDPEVCSEAVRAHILKKLDDLESLRAQGRGTGGGLT